MGNERIYIITIIEKVSTQFIQTIESVPTPQNQRYWIIINPPNKQNIKIKEIKCSKEITEKLSKLSNQNVDINIKKESSKEDESNPDDSKSKQKVNQNDHQNQNDIDQHP